jgi:hypothetical protein
MSDVFFASSRVREFRRWWVPEESLLVKMERVFREAGLDALVSRGGRIGIKLHMGEPGNVHYLRPIYATRMVDLLRSLGGEPELIETSGLGWLAGRTSAERHREAARRNGFCEETVGAPLVMVDGEDGLAAVQRGGVAVAAGMQDLDGLVVLSHATAHIQAGFGGAIKNLGLGCVAKPAKFRVHFEGKPTIDRARCTACGECVDACPAGAISRDPVEIHPEDCVGCNLCLDLCRERAVRTQGTTTEETARRTAENAAAVVKVVGKGKIGYLTLLVDILPHCDCHPHSDVPMVPDLGVLSSKDPVAIDRAAIDLINAAPGIRGTASEDSGALKPGIDRLQKVNPQTHWRLQLEEAEKRGLGTQGYELRGG